MHKTFFISNCLKSQFIFTSNDNKTQIVFMFVTGVNVFCKSISYICLYLLAIDLALYLWIVPSTLCLIVCTLHPHVFFLLVTKQCPMSHYFLKPSFPHSWPQSTFGFLWAYSTLLVIIMPADKGEFWTSKVNESRSYVERIAK